MRLEIVTAAMAAVALGLPAAGLADPIMFVTLSEGGGSFLTLPDNGTGRIQFSNLSYFGYELGGLACDSNFCGGPGSPVPEVELVDFSAVCGPGGFQGHACPEIGVAFGETVDTALSATPAQTIDAQSHIQGGWAVSTNDVNTLIYGGQIRQGGTVGGLIPFDGFFGDPQFFPAGIGGSTSNSFTFDLGPQPFGVVSTSTSDLVFSQGAEIPFAAAGVGDQLNIQNAFIETFVPFNTGSPTPTPEPDPGILLSVGLGVTALARLRKRARGGRQSIYASQ